MHWLPVGQRSVFKTATLVYKFLNCGYPKYFSTFLSLYHSAYNTRRGRPDRNFLVVPQFRPSIHKSKRHFSHSFAYDAPKVWNDLPDEIRSAPSLASFRKKTQDIPIHQSLSTIIFFQFLPVVSVVLTLATSLNYESCLTTMFVAP